MQHVRVWAWVFCVVMVASVAWVFWSIYTYKHHPYLRVDVLDIGQGDAILITTPSQTRVLIDTGPNQQVLQALGRAVPLYVRKLDAVLLTHPDLDHIGGTVDLFSVYDVPLLLTASTSKANNITEAIDALNTPTHVLQRGDRIILDPLHNVYADVLAPDVSWAPEDSNDSSIVLKLVYGNTCFLLTGDASIKVEQALVYMYRDALNCDVLKVGHHGSHTSTSTLFVGSISPTYAAISAGKDNDFGHPHQAVLDILRQFGVQVLRTDQIGTISFVSDGVTVNTKNTPL